jgi:hypothetical protein
MNSIFNICSRTINFYPGIFPSWLRIVTRVNRFEEISHVTCHTGYSAIFTEQSDQSNLILSIYSALANRETALTQNPNRLKTRIHPGARWALSPGFFPEHPDHPGHHPVHAPGYVVGQAGLGRALLILAQANGISILTSLSLSAVATNLRIKRCGDYYLISRTLGHEFGSAIGLVMFLAQSISIGFYCIGFAEVFAVLLPAPLQTHPHFIATAAACLLFVFAWLGADWATRFQFVVMAVLVAALSSFFRCLAGVFTVTPARICPWGHSMNNWMRRSTRCR